MSEAERTLTGCPVTTNARKSVSHNTRPGPKKYVKERSLTWSHGTINGVWRQHSSTSISVALENPVKVFSYDSKDDTVYIQTMTCDILSKEETMEASSDRHRPQVSDFQDDDNLSLAYQQHQFQGPPTITTSYQIRCHR
jgi:hypothetical protein